MNPEDKNADKEINPQAEPIHYSDQDLSLESDLLSQQESADEVPSHYYQQTSQDIAPQARSTEVLIPKNSKRRIVSPKSIGLFIFIVLCVACAVFVFLRAKPASILVTDTKSQPITDSTSLSLLGYLGNYKDGQAGDVELTYQSSAASDVKLAGNYVASNNSVHLSLTINRSYINDFLKELFNKSLAQPGVNEFDSEKHGLSEYVNVDLAPLLNLDFFSVPAIPAQDILRTQLTTGLDTCETGKKLKTMVAPGKISIKDFPLIKQEGDVYRLDTSFISNSYIPLVNSYIEDCLVATASPVDKSYYEDFKRYFSSEIPEYLIKIEVNGDSRTITMTQNPSKPTQNVLSIKLSSPTETFDNKVSSSKAISDRTTLFSLLMESCRHAPVMASNFAAGYNYDFIEHSKYYDYPVSFDSAYTCSTRDSRLEGYHPTPASSLVVGSNSIEVNSATIKELDKDHQIKNALEEHYKVKGIYPDTQDIMQLTGQFLKASDMTDHNGKAINQGLMTYKVRKNGAGYELTHDFGQVHMVYYEYGSLE